MLLSSQFDYSKTSKNDLECQITSQFIANLGVPSDEAFDLRSTAMMKDTSANC